MSFPKLFESKKFAFLPYICLGYPTLAESIELVRTLEPYADGFELGIPFSDPVADGPVLQAASHKALQNGFHVAQTFAAIRSVRTFTQKPIAIMTYLNPVLAYGLDRFVADAHAAGADALIVPDAPLDEIAPVQKACDGKLDVPLFITPTTSPERAEGIAKAAGGFVYGIAVKGVTGTREERAMDADVQALVEKTAASDKPLVVGFGVSNAAHVKSIRKAGAAGFIVGSRIVQAFDEGGLNGIKNLAKSIS